MSGDIAFSGNANEFAIALEFLNGLRTAITSIKDVKPQFVMVPGNHDCDFATDNTTRKRLIDSIAQSPDSTTCDESLATSCVCVQKEFFELRDTLCPKAEGELTKIAYQYRFSLGPTYHLLFQCYNTAWVSQLKEVPGRMVFPSNMLQPFDSSATVIVSVFHHPYNWLQPDNARAFRRHVSTNSDIILTGHEHDATFTFQQTASGIVNEWLEGGALHGDNSVPSAFNTVLINLAERTHKFTQHTLEEDNLYTESDGFDWRPLRRSTQHTAQLFEPNEEFAAFLSSLEMNLTHPHKQTLRLEDLYLFPDLRLDRYEGEAGDLKYKEGANAIVEYILKEKHVLVIGPEKSGRTAFLKTLYRQLQNQGIVPVYIDGTTVSTIKPDKILKQAHSTFVNQYNSQILDKFRQLPTGKKAFLIDDLSKSELNSSGRAKYVAELAAHADIVVVTGHELVQLEQLTGKDKQTTLLEFQHCTLMQFGHRLRYQMIEKWIELGREYTLDEIQLQKQVEDWERRINVVFSKTILPSYPFFILITLQTLEANTAANTGSGTYGYLIEALILPALARFPDHTPDTKAGVMAELAYFAFSNKQRDFTKEDYQKVVSEYQRVYKNIVEPGSLLSFLKRSDLLQEDGGIIRFKYQYVFYYFVARYLRDNLADVAKADSVKAHIRDMSRGIHREDNANIILFLCHLSKDAFIIEQMLVTAREIFATSEPIRLEDDVEWLNKLTMGPAPTETIELPDAHPRDSKKEYLRAQDEHESAHDESAQRETGTAHATSEADSANTNENGGKKVMALTVAFKTLQILGQLLRNFSGSTKGDTKDALTKEAYDLGLRIIGGMLQVMRENESAIRLLFNAAEQGKTFSEAVSEAKSPTPDALAAISPIADMKARAFIFLLCNGLTNAVIKKVSNSVGAKELAQVYSDILSKQPTSASSLIDTCVKLDFFPNIPEQQILSLAKQMKKNTFSMSCLRWMVAEYIYLHTCNYRTRDVLCSNLNIKIAAKKLIVNRQKREPRA